MEKNIITIILVDIEIMIIQTIFFFVQNIMIFSVFLNKMSP